jgi:hypothetical protein
VLLPSAPHSVSHSVSYVPRSGRGIRVLIALSKKVLRQFTIAATPSSLGLEAVYGLSGRRADSRRVNCSERRLSNPTRMSPITAAATLREVIHRASSRYRCNAPYRASLQTGHVANGLLRVCDRCVFCSHLVCANHRFAQTHHVGRCLKVSRGFQNTLALAEVYIVACVSKSLHSRRRSGISSSPSHRSLRTPQTRYRLARSRTLSLAPALRPNQGGGHVDAAHERTCEPYSISFFYSPSMGLLEECRFRAPRCVLQSWMR